MNDEDMIAPCLDSSSVSFFKPEYKNKFELIKDQNSFRKNDFLIHGNIPVALYSNILTFTDSNKYFKFERDLLKTMTNYEFNVNTILIHRIEKYSMSLQKK